MHDWPGVHWEDFLGNRAPFADPAATAVWSGLSLSTDYDDLVATYVAAVLGVGYGLRQIIEAQRSHGIAPSSIVVSGGAGQSPAIKQLIADATGMPVAGSASPEPVLLGAAMLGAVASGAHDTLVKAMAAMSSIERQFLAEGGHIKQMHDARYRAFCTLQEAEHRLRADLADLR
ncbi:FGGY-family carbohydrate kinase [Nioella aestuarii]|uniref:FGGY-family carbohydrate kinase n=1 Tax=Nioella aestuarii TaxID=1662864 RepID=UPI003D7F1DE8